MPIIHSTFRAAPVPYTNHRAYANVSIVFPAAAAIAATVCRVDTGSDVTILPMSVANQLGIVTTGTLKIATLSGRFITLPTRTSLTLEINGRRAPNRRVAFSQAAITPVVGLHDLLSAFHFGFDPVNWHHD